jgi:hypothetical protein
MKLKFLIPIAVFFCMILSSCLKDTPFLDASNTAPIIEFGQSPAQGLTGPFLYGFDTYGVYGPPSTYISSDSTILTDTAIALVLASPQVEPDTLQTIIAIDTTQITAFNQPAEIASFNGQYTVSPSAANNNYQFTPNFTSVALLPVTLYTISDTVNILPGYRVGSIPLVLKFPGIHNYALPLKIVSSYFLHIKTNVIISGNSGTFMWVFL